MNDKTHNCICLICKEVKATQNGMLYHLRVKHNKKMIAKKNWDWTKKAAPKITSKKKTKINKQPVITPNSKYIDIHAVIRIPISVGQVQILPVE